MNGSSRDTAKGASETNGPADYYEQIIASLTSGVIAVDRDGLVMTVNPAACTHLSISSEALRPGVLFDSLEGTQRFVEIISEIRVHPRIISRREVVLETGAISKIIGLTASPLQGPQAYNGVAFLFIDLTEVHKLEQAAELNRQLAQIGELTAGVVHEIRNPLSVISGMAELLMRQVDGDETLERRAKAIVEETGRLERLISQFLSFAKPFEIEKLRCDPEDILDRSVQLCERVARDRKVRIEARCEPRLPYLNADRTKVSQALANVIRNAIEIVHAGEKVSIRGRLDNGEVVFRVEDTGPGIHLKEGENLFSPFFSKKDGGTGLGLSIVHRIITAHGGRITYGNRDKGAWFELTLPIAD